MSKPRLLIANGSPEFCRTMAASFRDFADTQSCYTGRQALAHLRSKRFELMLLDLSLPELDGLTVLKTAQVEQILPSTLVTLDLQSVYIAQTLGKLQISYAMVKPCDPQAVLANLLDIAASLPGAPAAPAPAPSDELTEILLTLRFNPNHDGYEYCKKAIPMFAENPDQFVTKELYAAVGKHFGKTRMQVERSMRTAIEKAWDADDAGLWQRYFPGMTTRPTNKVFISAMARLLFPAENYKAG